MKNKIKLAIWGLGRHAFKRILPAIEKTKSVELFGIYTRNQIAGKKEANKRGCRYFSSKDEMLSDPNIKAIFLSTPTGLHYSQGRSIILSGKHLWCEKPIATNLKHSKELIDLALKKNIFLGEGYMYKHNIQFKVLKNYVENLDLGKLEKLICRFSIPTLDNPGFRINPRLGASALLDLGSYTFSLAGQIFKGLPTIDFAEFVSDTNSIDQKGFCILNYKNKAKAILEWSYDSCYINQAELWFENGRITTDNIFSKPDNYRPIIKVQKLNGSFIEEKLIHENSYVNMLNDFSDFTLNNSIRHYDSILLTSKLMSIFSKYVRMPMIPWK